MSSTPHTPIIHLGWLAPEALAAEPYREVFELALRAYGWPKIMLDEGLTDRGWEGFADRAAALVRRQVVVSSSPPGRRPPLGPKRRPRGASSPS